MAVQTPEYRNDSRQKLENLPFSGRGGRQPEILGGLASFSRGSEMAVVSYSKV